MVLYQEKVMKISKVHADLNMGGNLGHSYLMFKMVNIVPNNLRNVFRTNGQEKCNFEI